MTMTATPKRRLKNIADCVGDSDPAILNTWREQRMDDEDTRPDEFSIVLPVPSRPKDGLTAPELVAAIKELDRKRPDERRRLQELGRRLHREATELGPIDFDIDGKAIEVQEQLTQVRGALATLDACFDRATAVYGRALFEIAKPQLFPLVDKIDAAIAVMRDPVTLPSFQGDNAALRNPAIEQLMALRDECYCSVGTIATDPQYRDSIRGRITKAIPEQFRSKVGESNE